MRIFRLLPVIGLPIWLLVTQPVRGDVPLPHIPTANFNIADFGATADGKTMNTAAITRAIDACTQAGGGTVNIPQGRFLTGPIALASNLNLHLDKGAVLLLSNKFDDFLSNDPRRYANQIVADSCHDVSITGQGTIDGQGDPWWKEFTDTKNSPNGMPHRPYMVVMHDCTRVLVQGVTLTNSPSFHLVPAACHDVTIDHVQFIAPANARNTDALDPSGWNYLITNCTFDEGDDCIAIKATGKAPAGHVSCEDFLVTNCNFKHGHGLSIGGQTPGGLRHLVVRDCSFENTDAGIRMKANRGSGGLVEDCVYENLTMKNVKVPVYITSYYPEKGTPKNASDDPAQPTNANTPVWRNIHIRNLTATDSKFAGKIVGLAEMPVSDIEFSNVKISADQAMSIWNAKAVHFADSEVTVAAKESAIDVQQSTDITGLNLETGKKK